MNSCPKCRSYRINGPRYFKGDYGQESLVYTCSQCGYEKHEPTADADAQSGHPFLFPRATGGTE